MVENPYNSVLTRAYHNVLLLEETKRKYSRTTTSFRGRNAMEYIYAAAEEGKGSRTQHEIADYLKISRPSCTELINKLEALGYVERRKNLQDERSVEIALTRKGRLVTVVQSAHRNRMIDQVISEFSPEEQETIYNGFVRLNEVFEECIRTLENSEDHREKLKGAGR
ncbi:MAG: MarR family transcriptional regulator [Firmicutes bacterium]|jgi:DNA-binding MarR family transcriptional regulator|nr:MarR family transcriptional regulator [Bacillota bacterium]